MVAVHAACLAPEQIQADEFVVRQGIAPVRHEAVEAGVAAHHGPLEAGECLRGPPKRDLVVGECRGE